MKKEKHSTLLSRRKQASAAADASDNGSQIDEPAFWRERRGWPYMHYCISMALQAARLLPLEYSFLILYVHESIECAFSLRWPSNFRETRQDSVLGDILMGSLGVMTMWVVDESLDSQSSAQVVLPLWVRLSLLVALYPTSYFFIRLNQDADGDGHENRLQFGTLAYGVFYTLLVVVASAVAGSAAPHSVDNENVKLAVRTAIWLVLVMVQTGNAAQPHAAISMWQQVFYVGLALLFAMLLLGYFINLAHF